VEKVEGREKIGVVGMRKKGDVINKREREKGVGVGRCGMEKGGM